MGLYPFYVNDKGLNELVDPPEFQEIFGLPDNVMQALLAWDQLYDDLFDRDDPRKSREFTPAEWDHFHETGRAACRLLRGHLPADVGIEYTGADSIASEFY